MSKPVKRSSQWREVDVPEELADALAADPDARAAFDDLAYSHRREYAAWVAEGKREETRRRRAGKTVTMLREGTKPR